VHVERFAQHTVRAKVEGCLHHFRRAECGHEHHWTPREAAPDLLEELQVSGVGQAVVEQDGIDQGGPTDGVEGLTGARRLNHRVAAPTQHFGKGPPQQSFVVNDEDR
jgi:hypothetical protein